MVNVRASDGQLYDEQTITVTVTSVNESPSISSNGGGNTASKSVSENQTAVTTVTASDPDAGTTLTYSKVEERMRQSLLSMEAQESSVFLLLQIMKIPRIRDRTIPMW